MLPPVAASATLSDTSPGVLGQSCERHLSEAIEKELLRGVKGWTKRCVDRLLNDAAGRLRPVSDSEQRWRSERGVDVTQRYLGEIAGQNPASAMSFFRLDLSLLTETGHDSPKDHRVGVHGLRHVLGCKGPLGLRHVQEDVKDA